MVSLISIGIERTGTFHEIPQYAFFCTINHCCLVLVLIKVSSARGFSNCFLSRLENSCFYRLKSNWRTISSQFSVNFHNSENMHKSGSPRSFKENGSSLVADVGRRHLPEKKSANKIIRKSLFYEIWRNYGGWYTKQWISLYKCISFHVKRSGVDWYFWSDTIVLHKNSNLSRENMPRRFRQRLVPVCNQYSWLLVEFVSNQTLGHNVRTWIYVFLVL